MKCQRMKGDNLKMNKGGLVKKEKKEKSACTDKKNTGKNVSTKKKKPTK